MRATHPPAQLWELEEARVGATWLQRLLMTGVSMFADGACCWPSWIRSRARRH